MAKRRITLDEDVSRISDSIYADSYGKIVDRDTFDMHYKDFFATEPTTLQDTRLKNKVFRDMKQKHPDISSRRIFTEAEGKDLKRDRMTTAKEVTTSKSEYKRKGASRVDLKGYDTKQKRRFKYNYVGQRKGKIVYARRTFVNVQGKRKLRYRDSRGRFVSTKQIRKREV